MTTKRQNIINDRAIRKMKDIKYLGFVIDRKLKFKCGIKYI